MAQRRFSYRDPESFKKRLHLPIEKDSVVDGVKNNKNEKGKRKTQSLDIDVFTKSIIESKHATWHKMSGQESGTLENIY